MVMSLLGRGSAPRQRVEGTQHGRGGLVSPIAGKLQVCYSEKMSDQEWGALIFALVLIGCVLADLPRWISAFYDSLRRRRADASVRDPEIPE